MNGRSATESIWSTHGLQLNLYPFSFKSVLRAKISYYFLCLSHYWQMIITTAGGSKSNNKRQGITFIAKNRAGDTLFVGCHSTRLKHPILAQATAIQEGLIQANKLGFTKVIILTESKTLEQIMKGNQQQNWQLTPIFADIKNLIQLQGLQLQIFKVPATLLLEAKAMADSASQYFVNVTSVALNFIL